MFKNWDSLETWVLPNIYNSVNTLNKTLESSCPLNTRAGENSVPTFCFRFSY